MHAPLCFHIYLNRGLVHSALIAHHWRLYMLMGTLMPMPLMAHPPGSPWQLWPRLLSRTQPAIAAAASPVGLCPACAPVGGPDQTWAAGMEYKYEMTRCCHWGTGNWLGAVEVSKRPATNNMQIRRVMEPIGTMHIFIPNECQVTGRTARRSHSRPPRTCHPSHRPFRRVGWGWPSLPCRCASCPDTPSTALGQLSRRLCRCWSLNWNEQIDNNPK